MGSASNIETFLAGFAAGIFTIVVLPVTIFWIHCRVMCGKYNNSNASKPEDD